MTEPILARLFEHHNWANDRIIRACLALTDAQLDAEPHSATQGSIRSTLFHLVTSQQGYLRLLSVPLERRLADIPIPLFSELQSLAAGSGEALLALARDETSIPMQGRIRTRDGFYVEHWVLLVQIINHATEHREQIKSMLTALGLTAPAIDGWDFAEYTHAMLPVENDNNPASQPGA